MTDSDLTYEIPEIENLLEQGFVVEERTTFGWNEISGRKRLDEHREYRASRTSKRVLIEGQKARLFYGDTVIFKQKEARHLSVFSELEFDYQDGIIINIDNELKQADLIWLQGHHSRNDTVAFDDIVAVVDLSAPSCAPEHLGFSGHFQILNEILEPPKLKG